MLSCCAFYSRCRSLIIFIFVIETSRSISDSHHQLLRTDVGQDITMSCLFDQEKIEQVSFMRQMTGDILSLGSELFVHQTSPTPHVHLKLVSPNRLDFKLISVQQNDSGIYTCMFNDEQLTSYLVDVLVPPEFLSFSPVEGSVSSPEGSAMNLSCHAFAEPPVNITWMYTKKKKQSQIIHYGEYFYLPSIQPSDSGLYECVASNLYHVAISRSFFVTVQYSPRIFLLNKPILRHSLTDRVQLGCRVCAVPNVDTVHWLRNEQAIIDANTLIKSRILNEQCSESIMEILSIEENQFGQYQCRAENLCGEKSQSIQLEEIRTNRRVKEKVQLDDNNRNERTTRLETQPPRRESNQTAVVTLAESARFTEMVSSSSNSSAISLSSLFVLFMCIHSSR